jgi:hypothetical protein
MLRRNDSLGGGAPGSERGAAPALASQPTLQPWGSQHDGWLTPLVLAHCSDAGHADTIVAGGGDGTLNELAAALLRPPGGRLLGGGGGLTVAQLPLGTANDLASACGISLVGGGGDRG